MKQLGAPLKKKNDFLIRYAQPKMNHLEAIVPYAMKGQDYYDNSLFV